MKFKFQPGIEFKLNNTETIVRTIVGTTLEVVGVEDNDHLAELLSSSHQLGLHIEQLAHEEVKQELDDKGKAVDVTYLVSYGAAGAKVLTKKEDAPKPVAVSAADKRESAARVKHAGKVGVVPMTAREADDKILSPQESVEYTKRRLQAAGGDPKRADGLLSENAEERANAAEYVNSFIGEDAKRNQSPFVSPTDKAPAPGRGAGQPSKAATLSPANPARSAR